MAPAWVVPARVVPASLVPTRVVPTRVELARVELETRGWEQLCVSRVRIGIGGTLESGARWNRARVGIGCEFESGARSSRACVRVGQERCGAVRVRVGQGLGIARPVGCERGPCEARLRRLERSIDKPMMEVAKPGATNKRTAVSMGLGG